MKRCLCLLVLLVACDPPIVPTEDTPAVATRIEGVLRTADGAAPGGAGILLRYDCRNPPPPTGSGTPVDFLILEEDAWDDGAVDWIFPTVPPGSCVILTGFIDRDDDFHYAFGTAGQPTAGDVGISAVSVTTGSMPEQGQFIAPTVGIELVADRPVSIDRPVFTFTEVGRATPGGDVTLGRGAGSTETTMLSLQVRALDTSLVEADAPVFTVVFNEDADGDGWPDDDNGDGAPDILWPRVLLFRLDPADPTGLTRAQPTVLLPGVVLPLDRDDAMNPATNLMLRARAAGVPFDGRSVLPATALTVAVPPLAVTDLATSATVPLEAFAAEVEVPGEYQVLVMNSTGQVWSLPNELADFGSELDGLRFAVDPPAGDDAFTSVRGTVELDEEPGGDAYVVRFACDDPPPPAGTGSPIDLAVVKEEAFVDGTGSFLFRHVPAATCVLLLGFVDRDGDFSAFYGTNAGATAGDLSLVTATAPTGAASGGVVPPTVLTLTPDFVVPIDPPAFTVSGPDKTVAGADWTLGATAGSTENLVLELDVTTLESDLMSVDQPVFTVVLNEDADGDGWPDDDNGDGVPDVLWPRVLLLRLDPADPYQLETTSPPVVLPGVVLPLQVGDPFDFSTNLVLASMEQGLPFDGATVLPQTSLRVVVPPLVVTDLATRSTAPIEDVAATTDVTGAYQIVVMNSSGQLWTVPNEIGALGASRQAETVRIHEAGIPAEPRTVIAGALDLDGLVAEPGGRAYVARYDCDDPPPPQGSGRPVDLAVVFEEDFAAGLAPYVLTQVPAGSCVLVTAFVDRDGDFDAFYGPTAGITAGDIVFGAEVVQVPEADAAGIAAPAVQDLVAVAPLPFERPAFSIAQTDPQMTLGATPGSTPSLSLILESTPLSTVFGAVENPVFPVVFAPDLDGDPLGWPDDLDGDGLPDALWPRVLLRRLDPADPDGLTVAEPPITLPGIVVTVNPFDPLDPGSSLVAAAADAGAAFDGSTPFPTTALSIVVPPLVLTSLDPVTTAPLEAVAQTTDVTGRYQVLVMNAQGQTWSLPNEVAAFGPAHQGVSVRVAE